MKNFLIDPNINVKKTVGNRQWWAWNMGHGAWSMEHGAWGMGHGAWSMEHEAWSRKYVNGQFVATPNLGFVFATWHDFASRMQVRHYRFLTKVSKI